MRRRNEDTLEPLRKALQSRIAADYASVEDFCWDKNLNKATISNFLNDRKDFQLSTLRKIAEALGKRLEIRLRDG